MGRVEPTHSATASAFELLARNGERLHATDGAVSADGQVVGTMLHGLFENHALRSGLLQRLRARRGLAAPAGPAAPAPDSLAEYDRLEAVVREHIDRALLHRLARMDAP